MLGQTHIQEVNLIENVVDKKYKKYDAFLWKFSHGGLFLASGYSEKSDGFRRKFRAIWDL